MYIKYERDIHQLTSGLTMVKNQENNGTEEIALEIITPHPSS